MTIQRGYHARKKHRWSDQDGFRRSTCNDCKATKSWDSALQRTIYYDRFGNGPFYWAPKCDIILSTNGNA